MKKMITLILIVVTLAAIVIPAAASGRTVYNPEKAQFVVVAYDAEKAEIYTGVYTLQTVAKLARENAMCSCYGLEADGLVPLDWTVEDGKVTFTSLIDGEVYAEK